MKIVEHWDIRRRTRGRYFADTRPLKNYHEASKHRGSVFSRQSPEQILSMQKKKPCTQVIPVTAFDQGSLDVPFSDIMIKRRTSWNFQGVPLSNVKKMETFLNVAFGISMVRETLEQNRELTMVHESRLRTYPSGGSQYPVKIYIVSNLLEFYPSNTLMEFDPVDSQLRCINEGIDTQRIKDMHPATKFGHREFDMAQFFVFLATDVYSPSKYGLLQYRLSFLEAGHIGQNIMLTATALEWSSVPIGGFFEDELNHLLGLTTYNETVLYFFPVG